MLRFSLFLGLGVLSAFILAGCAKVGMPTGGPVDSLPPVLVEADPPLFSTGVKPQKIEVKLDEFIQFKDLRSQLVISPLLDEKPIIRTKGKGFTIEIESPLKDSTTYLFNFRNSIADLNEGNPFPAFSYVFSTGPVIDSLLIAGTLVNAFDLKPLPDHYVMVYLSHHDSVPRTILPDYITLSDSSGGFVIPFIRNGVYKLFALADKNNNYRFDLPDEEIAFTDSLYAPFSRLTQLTDTLHIDSLERDTVIVRTVAEFFPNDISLYLFQEDNRKQYITKSERSERAKITMSFNLPLEDEFSPIPLNFSPYDSLSWFFTEYSPLRDSVVMWLKDSTVFMNDSLKMAFSYQSVDSANQPITVNDTLKFFFKDTKKKKSKDKAVPVMSVNSNVKKSGYLEQGEELLLQFNAPVQAWDTARLKLFFEKDTLMEYVHDSARVLRKERFISPVAFTTDTPDVPFTMLKLRADWKQNSEYRIFCDTATFLDIYGRSHDTVEIAFKTRQESYYGSVVLHITNTSAPFIVELQSMADKTLRTQFISGDTTVTLELLAPKTSYIVKFTEDFNANRKWDTGKYEQHLQAERVFYYPTPVETVSGFAIELNWEPPVKPFRVKIPEPDKTKAEFTPERE